MLHLYEVAPTAVAVALPLHAPKQVTLVKLVLIWACRAIAKANSKHSRGYIFFIAFVYGPGQANVMSLFKVSLFLNLVALAYKLPVIPCACLNKIVYVNRCCA